MPEFMPDFVNIDHRRARGFAPGDLTAYMRATWDVASDVTVYVETVHRVSDLGAVFTHAGKGTSQAGFEAEWRTVDIMTVQGDLISRVDLFDEADLDAAIARFDELSRPAPHLENTASRIYVRFNAYLAARDWDAMSEMIADDVRDDDRRRVVSGGIQRGRDAQIANLRAVVDVGVKNIELVVIATRGERLALCRARVSGGARRAEAFSLEMLSIVEIDTENRIAAAIQFDLDAIDAAFARTRHPLRRRRSGRHIRTRGRLWWWPRGHQPARNTCKAPDFVNIDHRRGRAFASGDLYGTSVPRGISFPDVKFRSRQCTS